MQCNNGDRTRRQPGSPSEQELRRKLDIAKGSGATAAILRNRLVLDRQDGWAMSAADQRLAELFERWKTSVDMHARYLALDDSAYARMQDWPKHERPTRWVVELARTRLLELSRITDERRSRGDSGFAEALELMAFLTNLLGSEHVERFIPLAQPSPPMRPVPTKANRQVEPTGETRSPRTAAPPKQARRAESPRTEPRPATAARPARTVASASRRLTTPAPRPAPADEAPVVSNEATATVIADAVRLISWGREWPQLAGLIARLANRPAEAEVWKILRKHRAEIETQARRPRD
jgi:hypothetical protein